MTGLSERYEREKTDDFVVFTIVANNYFAYAKTLMASVAKAHPKSKRFIVLCDDPSPDIDYDAAADIILARDLGIDDFARMTFVYDVMELSTALKPFTFLYLFDRFKAPGFLYIDPDIIVLRPLEHIRKALDDGHTMVLTPHMMQPLQDGLEPSDLSIMKSGVYNLGFLGAQSADECYAFIKWWAARCFRDAIVDIPEHKFTDQRWMDLAPAFVSGSFILRHPGYNLAYWNLLHRPVTEHNGDYRIGDDAVHFVHFSGVVPSDPSVFSKHQNRFTIETIGGLRPLFEDYVNRLVANGWPETHKTPYAFGRFSNGRSIHRAMRLSFRRHDDAQWPMDIAPRDEDGSRYDEAEPSLQYLGPPFITRAMYENWVRRTDLQAAFPLTTAEGRHSYLSWFIQRAKMEEKFDQLSIEAAERAVAEEAPVRPAKPEPVPNNFLPWPPQASATYEGPKEYLVEWLTEPITLWVLERGTGIPLPRALALLWEGRMDLRRHFPNTTMTGIEQYLVWCITSAAYDGVVEPRLLEGAVGAFMDADETDGDTDEIPRTRLMRHMRGRYSGQFHQLVRDNPNAPFSDQILAIWLCGAARNQYHWPARFVESLSEWLCRPSALFHDPSLGLSNAMAAVYMIRPDLQAVFDITTDRGCAEFASWVINNGVLEHEFGTALIPEAFRAHLLKPAPGAHGRQLTNFHRLAWLRRGDLHGPFPLNTAESEAAYIAWSGSGGLGDNAFGFWVPYLFPTLEDHSVPQAKTPSICLTGLWTSASGRGEDVRMTAAVLTYLGIDFVVFDRISRTFLDRNGKKIDVDADAIEVNIVHLNADTACSDFLAFWRAGMTQAYSIGYWAWELDRVPEEWRASYSFYDEIWASTNFAKHAFEFEGLRPVELVPMAVETPRIDAKKTRADFGLGENSYVFYYGFDFRSFMTRKNPEAAITAFKAAFPDKREDVTLVLKTLGGADRPQEFKRLLNLIDGDPRIELRDHEYSAIELATLIHFCDCFVSPHRSEGFGRGPAEAMRLGLPVIATGYSGNIDFTTPDTAFLIDFQLIDVQDGQYPGWEGQIWADVDVDHLAQLMRMVFERGGRDRAAAGRAFMEAHFSVSGVAPLFSDRLSTILSELSRRHRTELSASSA